MTEREKFNALVNYAFMYGLSIWQLSILTGRSENVIEEIVRQECKKREGKK